MANGTTFDPINGRFFDQRIKVPVVVCQEEVQEVGDLEIPAPVGVTFDPVTGLLEQIVTLVATGLPVLTTTTVLPGKIVNQGFVPVSLFVNGVETVTGLTIPFQGEIECPGVVPGPGVIVQKHDVQIEGFSVGAFTTTVAGVTTVTLVLKVVLALCLIVARETIIKVNAAEVFCR